MWDQRYRKTGLLVVAFIAGAVAVACSDDTTGPAGNNNEPPEENVVQLTASETFTPSLDTVAVNTTIEWRNTGGIEHTLTSNDDEWQHQSVPADETWTFTHTFDEAGTYDYRCQIHSGMTGRIVVE